MRLLNFCPKFFNIFNFIIDYSLKVSFYMDNNTEKIPDFNEYTGEYADGFAFWNDVKKYFYFLYLFIFFLCLILCLLNRIDWLTILFLELMTTPILFQIFMIRYVIVPHKSRLVKKIEEIQKEKRVIYEKFAESINCSARSPASIIYFSIFLYLLILVLYLGVGINLPEVIFFFGLFLFFYAIILPGIFNRRKDRIRVDPRNQRYIVKKKYFLFLYGKKRFYNWSELLIEVLGKKIHLSFNKEYNAQFKPDDDDYLQIVPKAFETLKGNNDSDKMRALKALSMYNTKKVLRLYFAYGLVLTIALFEVFFLTKVVFG